MSIDEWVVPDPSEQPVTQQEQELVGNNFTAKVLAADDRDRDAVVITFDNGITVLVKATDNDLNIHTYGAKTTKQAMEALSGAADYRVEGDKGHFIWLRKTS